MDEQRLRAIEARVARGGIVQMDAVALGETAHEMLVPIAAVRWLRHRSARPGGIHRE